MPTTLPPPNLLSGPGILRYALLGSALPGMVSNPAGTAFAVTDTWPTVWQMPGMTVDGTEFHPQITLAGITPAEMIDAAQFFTTDRVTAVQFTLMSFTAKNLALALNGATQTVTGVAPATVTKVTPAAPGTEARLMWGWESVAGDVRAVCYQAINSGDLATQMKKAPQAATFSFNLNLETPIATGQGFEWWMTNSRAA